MLYAVCIVEGWRRDKASIGEDQKLAGNHGFPASFFNKMTGGVIEVLEEKRLSDYLAEQIADAVLSRQMKGGTQLRQEELAESWNVSRIPVREALQIAENWGVVERLATRRIYTVSLSEDQITEIYEMIGALVEKSLDLVKRKGKWMVFLKEAQTSGQPFYTAVCHTLDNLYLCRMLKNASDCYLRFARGISAGKIRIPEQEKRMMESFLQEDEGQMQKEMRSYFSLLAEMVKEERRRQG